MSDDPPGAGKPGHGRLILPPASVNKNYPFVRALALQSSSRNCSPATDSAFLKPMLQTVFFSREMFFHRHRHFRSSPRLSSPGTAGPLRQRQRRKPFIGAKDCTPEIDTSEIIVDFQWHFPIDFQ